MTETSQLVRREYVDKGDTIHYVVSTTPVTPRPVVLNTKDASGHWRTRPATIVAIALVESYEKYGSPDRPRTHQQRYRFVTMSIIGVDDVIVGIPELDFPYAVHVCEPEVRDAAPRVGVPPTDDIIDLLTE